MLKVYILTSVHPRTDSRVFEKEARTLSQHGYEVTLLCADGKADEIVDGIRICSVKKESNRIKRMLFTTRMIYRKAYAAGADIYHLEDSELVSVGMSLVRHGCKVIYDIHEDVVGTVDEKPWIPSCLRRIVAFFLKRNEKCAATKLTGVITATPYLCEKYREWGSENVVCICNYPRVSDLQEPLTYAERIIDTAYTGICLTKNRGAIEMAKASAKAGVHFDVYGELRPPELRETLLSVADRDKIRFHGIIPYNELQDVMRNVKVGFLVEHPTENAKNALCIKMFEYMSHGITIICSDILLWQDIIESNNCGICVDPYNIDAIADAIGQLIDNPAESENMGYNGYKAVVDRYSWEKEEGKLLRLYEECLDKSQRCPQENRS